MAQLISGGKKVKGRGATDVDLDTSDRYAGEAGEFQEVPAEGDKSGPQRCTHLARGIRKVLTSAHQPSRAG